MGWDFGINDTKKDVVKMRTEDWQNDTHAYYCERKRVIGNIIWSVWRRVSKVTEETELFIACDILMKYKKSYGYKSLSEASHPFYYNCPLAYLDIAPVVCQRWRDGVINHHTIDKMEIKLGSIVELKGLTINYALITSVISHSIFIAEERGGYRRFRIKRKYLTGNIYDKWPSGS